MSGTFHAEAGNDVAESAGVSDISHVLRYACRELAAHSGVRICAWIWSGRNETADEGGGMAQPLREKS